MKKIIIILLLVFLGGCMSKEDPAGSIQSIKAASVIEKLDQQEDMILIIGTSTCDSCIAFEDTMNSYIKDHKIVLYHMLIDEEPLVENEDGVMERVDFLSMCDRLVPVETTPTIVWIQDGKMVHSEADVLDEKSFADICAEYGFD